MELHILRGRFTGDGCSPLCEDSLFCGDYSALPDCHPAQCRRCHCLHDLSLTRSPYASLPRTCRISQGIDRVANSGCCVFGERAGFLHTFVESISFLWCVTVL